MDEDFVVEDEHSEGDEQIKKLRARLKKCTEERQEYLEGWQRAKADLINERGELQKTITHRVEGAKEGLILELLSVLDSFDMAFSNKDAWEQVDQNWRAGIEHIYTHFLSVLAHHDITPFSPLGETFDPALHESLESISTTKKADDNKVLEVLQKGYRRGESVIRAAKVKVGAHHTSKDSKK